jgi:hypothetical protein
MQHKEPPNIADELTQLIEEEVGEKIFTIKITGKGEKPFDHLKAIIVFDNKEILDAMISIYTLDSGKMAVRTQGNWIG